MSEAFPRPDHVTAWHQASLVDWPASGFWREISAANPDALVILSRRESPEVWWQSASRTVLNSATQEPPDAVRAEIPPERLLEWLPADGWPPLCTAPGVPIPDEPFPHLNTSADFRVRAGWDT